MRARAPGTPTGGPLYVHTYRIRIDLRGCLSRDVVVSWCQPIRWGYTMTDTARHCRLCGTFHPELRPCPDLVPGWHDSADAKRDAADQARADRCNR